MKWEKAKRKYKYILIPIYALFYAVNYFTGISCIWKSLLGVSCPGCGYTRAVMSMIKLDFKQAWTYHPMYWSFFIIVALFIFEGDLFDKPIINKLIIGFLLFGFVTVWIYRITMGIEV